MKKILMWLFIFLLMEVSPLIANAEDSANLIINKNIPNNKDIEIEQLKKELQAQLEINRELSKRLNKLFERLSKSENQNIQVSEIDPSAPKPKEEEVKDGSTTAIKEALVSKGLVLLQPGSFKFTPNVTFVHDGSGHDRRDSYIGNIGIQTGLPWGMMVSANLPYIWNDFSRGTNNGVGNTSFRLTKKLNNESDSFPSLIAQLGYTEKASDKNAFSDIPIGSAFRSTNITLSALKAFSPLVVYSNFSYSHSFDRNLNIRDNFGTSIFDGKIALGDSYGIEMGISLAATPTISLDAGLSYTSIDGDKYTPIGESSYLSPRVNVGYMNMGANFLLSKKLLLNVSGSAGITKDSNDFTFGVALPYNF